MKKLQKSEFLPVLCVSRAVFKDNCPSPRDLLEEAIRTLLPARGKEAATFPTSTFVFSALAK